MWKRIYKKIKKAIEDRVSSTFSFVAGSILGSLLTVLGGSLAFTATFGTRFEAVEASTKEISAIKQQIEQLQISDTDKTESINNINTSQIRAEQRIDQIYNLLR